MKRQTTIHRDSGRGKRYPSILVAAMAAVALGWLAVAAAHDVANGTLAAAIRASGHPCNRVLEKKSSKTNPSVWHVRCNSGYFDVTMKGDTATSVVPAG